MQRPMTPASVSPEPAELQPMSPRPSADSEITWLLHRAAQRMRNATGERAEEHGLQLRDYIVLTALNLTPNLTQGELGKALGLDKTTLMSQLDKLERMGLVIRRHDPRDRRARIPQITDSGEDLREKVSQACHRVEQAALPNFTDDEVRLFRRMLIEIIGDSDDPGSCL
ncbi:MarR family transcriptional regulator [Mycolicibacterium litorale]|nr:MarR family transcriptional regulator [Mycolicibacterium litorale]